MLEPAGRPARARIVAPEFFEQVLAAMDDAQAAFNVRFGGEAASAFAGALGEKEPSSD